MLRTATSERDEEKMKRGERDTYRANNECD